MSPMRPKATKSTQSAPPTVVFLLSFDKNKREVRKISIIIVMRGGPSAISCVGQ
jgi:hypothetical protein